MINILTNIRKSLFGLLKGTGDLLLERKLLFKGITRNFPVNLLQDPLINGIVDSSEREVFWKAIRLLMIHYTDFDESFAKEISMKGCNIINEDFLFLMKSHKRRCTHDSDFSHYRSFFLNFDDIDLLETHKRTSDVFFKNFIFTIFPKEGKDTDSKNFEERLNIFTECLTDHYKSENFFMLKSLFENRDLRDALFQMRVEETDYYGEESNFATEFIRAFHKKQYIEQQKNTIELINFFREHKQEIHHKILKIITNPGDKIILPHISDQENFIEGAYRYIFSSYDDFNNNLDIFNYFNNFTSMKIRDFEDLEIFNADRFVDEEIEHFIPWLESAGYKFDSDFHDNFKKRKLYEKVENMGKEEKRQWLETSIDYFSKEEAGIDIGEYDPDYWVPGLTSEEISEMVIYDRQGQ